MRTVSAAVLLGLGVALGCGGGDGPLMRPGEDCMNCHDGSGGAPRWSVAGTVYACAEAGSGAGQDGVTVVVTDGAGTEITRMTSNSVGNFYTSKQVASPFHVYVERNGMKHEMGEAPTSGGCNGCHQVPPQNGAPGRLYVDQASCSAAPLDATQDAQPDSGEL